MDNIWDILIPVFVIGGVMLSAFSERQKKKAASKPIPPQMFSQTDTKMPKDTTSVSHSKPAQTKTPPEPFLSPITHSPSPKVATSIKKNNAYSKQGDEGEAAEAMDDIRRAIIAHEILKRKF